MEKASNRLQQKQQLLEDFFSIKTTSDRDQLEAFRQRILDYYRDQRDYISPDDLDPQLKNVYQLLEIYRLGAFNSTDYEHAYELSLPIFERLQKTEHWDVYDLRLMSLTINKHESLKATVGMLDRFEAELEPYRDTPLYGKLQRIVYSNLSARLLRSQFVGCEVSEEQIRQCFHKTVDKAIELWLAAENFGYVKALQVRKALADNDDQMLLQLMEELRELVSTDFYQAVEMEIRSFRSLLRMPEHRNK